MGIFWTAQNDVYKDDDSKTVGDQRCSVRGGGGAGRKVNSIGRINFPTHATVLMPHGAGAAWLLAYKLCGQATARAAPHQIKLCSLSAWRGAVPQPAGLSWSPLRGGEGQRANGNLKLYVFSAAGGLLQKNLFGAKI